MGYTNSRILSLRFAEQAMARDYKGNPLHVKMRPMTIGDFRALMRLSYDRIKTTDPEDLTEGDMTLVEKILELFASRLVMWNVEDEQDDGSMKHVPATPEGVNSQELAFVMRIIDAWVRECTSVMPEVKAISSGGTPSAELSLAMEPE